MDDKRIAEIRAVVERARARVPFKGRAYVGGDHICGDDGEDELYWYDLRMGESEWSFSEPALPELFAVAWNDLPDLLAALDAARADVARLREALGRTQRALYSAIRTVDGIEGWPLPDYLADRHAEWVAASNEAAALAATEAQP